MVLSSHINIYIYSASVSTWLIRGFGGGFYGLSSRLGGSGDRRWC